MAAKQSTQRTRAKAKAKSKTKPKPKRNGNPNTQEVDTVISIANGHPAERAAPPPLHYSESGPTGWITFSALGLLVIGLLELFLALAVTLDKRDVVAAGTGNASLIFPLLTWAKVYLVIGGSMLIGSLMLFIRADSGWDFALMLLPVAIVVQAGLLPVYPIYAAIIGLLCLLTAFVLTVVRDRSIWV